MADPSIRPGDPPKLKARWYALAAGMLAQAAVSSLQQGLPALGPLLRESLGLSLPALGALLASASWGVMLTVYLWGRLADLWGERAVVTAGLVGATAAYVAILWIETPIGLVCAIGAAGAMSGAAIAASGRAVMGWFPRSERGFALGLRQMAVPLGACYSALALPAVAVSYGLNGAFLALAALSGLGAVVALVALGPPPQAANGAPKTPTPPRSPVRDPAIWRLSSACGLMQWSQVALNTFFVVILVEHQAAGFALAVGLLAFVQAASGIARVGAGWWSDRQGRRIPHLFAYGLALVAALILAGALQTIQSPLSVVALVFACIMTFAWNGLAFAAVAELAGPGRAGTALGLHATLMRLLTLPTALLFGWMAATIGWSATIVLLAAFPLIGTFRIRSLIAEEDRRARLAEEGQTAG